jgi:hypothetical protein
MSANTAERVLPALAASRFTYTATQANVHLDAPLRDATAHLACRATCAAMHVHMCRRGTRLVRARVKKRARMALPSRKESRKRRCPSLDEPRVSPANPAGGSPWYWSTRPPHVHFRIGLDRSLHLRHNVSLLFSQCTTWQTYLLTSR